MWMERRKGTKKRAGKRDTFYYAAWREGGKIRREKLGTDKEACDTLFGDLKRQRALGRAGMLNPFREHMASPITSHVRDYIGNLKSEGRDDRYVSAVGYRINYLLSKTGWRTLADIDPNGFLSFRSAERENASREDGRSGKGASPRTLNHFLDAIRGFTNWCATVRRMEGVTMAGKTIATVLAGVGKVDHRQQARPRRALSEVEVGTLLSVTPEPRKLPYRLALASGLRRQELVDLQWGDLRLLATKPYIQCRVEQTKSRRADRIPLPESLATDLRALRPTTATDACPVFPKFPTLVYWKKDLTAAGIPYIDRHGKRVDFHGGTRKTLGTRLARAGVPVGVSMRLLRHTDPRLTMQVYVDADLVGAEDAPLAEIPATPATTVTTATPTAAAG